MKNWSRTENRRHMGETGARADRAGDRAGSRWRAGALAFLAAGVVGAILAGPAAAATLKGDYRFQDSLSSSVAGPLPLSNIELNGGNTFATETVDGSATRVLTFPKRNGVSFASTGQVSADAYSAMWLRYVEDMSVRDVARTLEKPMSWTKVTLMRSRRRLSAELAGGHDATANGEAYG